MRMSKLSFQTNKSKKICIVAAIILVAFAAIFALYRNHINKQVASYKDALTQYESRFEHYHYKDFKIEYITIIDNYKAGLDSKNLSLLKDCYEELGELELTVIDANTKKIEKKLKKLTKVDTSHAYETELKRMEEIQAEIQTKLETKHFTSITPLIKEWTNILNNMSFVADNLSIYVNQIDTSNYPRVSLYLAIHDIETNQTPEYLKEDYLYLTETISNTPVQLSVLSMEQLENNEAVTITIAIDTGYPRTEEETTIIQNSLDTFFNMTDSEVGDNVKIASDFSSSKLYDGLIEELEHLKDSATGAKCLIALTDSEDTDSSHTWEDVVALANQYQIPVYMIGVGREVSPYVLERIGTRTNGAYRNIHDFTDLTDVLKKIYSTQKAMYKIEFVSERTKFPATPYKLHIAYQHRLYGGVSEYEYTSTTPIE